MQTMSLRISGTLNLFAVALIAAFALATGAATYALMTLRVGGPVSDRQVEADALVADILPPPLFIVEALLTAHRGPDELDKAAVAGDADAMICTRNDALVAVAALSRLGAVAVLMPPDAG